MLCGGGVAGCCVWRGGRGCNGEVAVEDTLDVDGAAIGKMKFGGKHHDCC